MRALSVIALILIVGLLPRAALAETNAELQQRVDHLQQEVDGLKAQLSKSTTSAPSPPSGLMTQDMQNHPADSMSGSPAPASMPGLGTNSELVPPGMMEELKKQLELLKSQQKETQKFLKEIDKEL